MGPVPVGSGHFGGLRPRAKSVARSQAGLLREQAYLKGLDRFLGDPATLGSPDDIKEVMKGSTGVTFGELVTAYRDGAIPTNQATGLIFLPVLTQMYAGQGNGTLVL